jgi:adenylate kinase family enzyme
MFSFENVLSDVILIDGPPGSGKSYISGKYIKSNPSVQHVSAGDLIRGIRCGAVDSAFTSTVLTYLEKRELLPDEVFGDIVVESIANGGGAIDTSLLDGFPQKNGDFERVQDRLAESGKRILGAICLTATIETSVARMAYRGMRPGEEVRRQYVFDEDSDEIQYFRKRYLAHQRAREESLMIILESNNVRLEHIDVNPDILIEENATLFVEQFAGSVANLRDNS